MSQQSINTALQKTLISPLTHDKLWSQFLEAFSYELFNMREKFGEIKENWSINSINKDDLIRIAESFGYDPNLIINNTLFMSKKEIESIPYRIREKTTYSGYALIFHQNGLLGDTFNYYYNGEKLIKSIDYEKTIENLIDSNHYTPFIGIESIKNFSVMINSKNVMLDYLNSMGKIVYDDYSVRIYSLDQKFNPYWKLDTSYIKIPTKHLGIEYYPQDWKCNYAVALGVGDEEISEYTCSISSYNYYLKNSMRIFIDNKELEVTITEVGDKEYFSDESGILNSDSYYDTTNGKVVLNFDIIPKGLEISITYDLDLFVTKDYFYYLENGMEYNRRCPIIPHSGVFLTADISQAKGSDFYKRNDEGYTIPALKLKAQTTSSYNREIQLSEISKLDNKWDEHGVEIVGNDNYQLDSSIKWYLDSEISSDQDVVDKIKYIACGNEKLPMINEENNKIFNQKYIIVYYNFNTDDNDSLIRDASVNNNDCEVVGDTTKVKGIINKSLNFDGSVYCISESNLVLAENTNYTFGVWFNANKEPSTTTETIFDNFITIEYDYSNEKLIIEGNEYACAKNTDHFLCLLLSYSNGNISVYLDCELLGQFAYIVTSSSNKIYIGCDSNLANTFYGLIDNLWLIKNNITTNQMNYLYNNKISLITHMGNRLGYYPIATDEIYNDDNYTVIQSYVKAMDITNETYNIITNDETITSQTRFYPILKGYFSILYKNSLNKEIEIKANPKGEFYRTDTNEIVSGGINFEDGIWSLNRDTIKSVSQLEIDKPKTTPYLTAWKVTTEGVTNPTWYSEFDPYSSSSYDEYIIDSDEIDDSESTLISTVYKYLLSSKEVYSQDKESYYIRINNIDRTLKQYFINADDDETALYSVNDGVTVYLNLTDLENQANALKAYIDLNEATGTTLYSTANPQTDIYEMYLDVKCSSSKKVTKWLGEIDNISTYGYCLGNDTTTVYANLAFNSTITFQDGKTSAKFDKREISVKKTEVALSDNKDLNLQKTIEEYNNINSLEYIRSTNKIITFDESGNPDPNVDIVRDTITFSYWINNSEGEPIRYTATVLGEGIVSGENILHGNFDYSTNTLNVTFIHPMNSKIVTSYEYYDSLSINTDYPLIMNYKTEKSVKINEIGLEDENHELVAYMTFNDIEFHSIYDNISAMFAINKN